MGAAREVRMAEIRRERNRRLRATDGHALREMEQDSPGRRAWADYRQALRDLPATVDLGQAATPENLAAFEPAWPTQPGEN